MDYGQTKDSQVLPGTILTTSQTLNYGTNSGQI